MYLLWVGRVVAGIPFVLKRVATYHFLYSVIRTCSSFGYATVCYSFSRQKLPVLLTVKKIWCSAFFRLKCYTTTDANFTRLCYILFCLSAFSGKVSLRKSRFQLIAPCYRLRGLCGLTRYFLVCMYSRINIKTCDLHWLAMLLVVRIYSFYGS